jgi:hypothetical protein
VIAMENPHRADLPGLQPIPERDVVALLTMLDYLIMEISRIDAMSAQCLMLARKSLAEAVAASLVKAH